MSRSEIRELGELAWPVVLGSLGTMLMGMVDVAMVGRLGGDAMAVSSLAHTWSWAGLVFGMGVAMGVDPAFTQAYGAQDPRAAGKALVQGIVLVGVCAVPITALHLFAGPALTAMGQPAAIVPEAHRFSVVLSGAVVPFFGYTLLRQFLQGSGRMRPAMWVVLVANGVNALANYLLIFGHYGAPELGVVGSAWATTFSRWFMLLGLLAVSFGPLRTALPSMPSVSGIGKLTWVALPVGLHTSLEGWMFIAAGLMMGWLGPQALAAHSVAVTLASAAFMVPLGISAAATTRVGNRVGAGLPWARSAWTAVAMGCAAMTLSAFLFAVLPWYLARALTPDLAVVGLAATLLPIAAAFQLFDGLQVTCFGALRGVGDTRWPAACVLLGYWVVGIPSGYLLGFELGLGPRGLWWGLTAGLAAAAVLLVARLRVTQLNADS